MTHHGSLLFTLGRDLQVFCGFHAFLFSHSSLPLPSRLLQQSQDFCYLIISSMFLSSGPLHLFLPLASHSAKCPEDSLPYLLWVFLLKLPLMRLSLTTLFKIIPQPHLRYHSSHSTAYSFFFFSNKFYVFILIYGCTLQHER